jgi:uncharacterized membrane protein YfcA
VSEFALVPIAFLSSCIAGVIGMGGGVLLIATMPGLISPAAIIPVHALTQLASNASRAWFGQRYIDWQLVPAIGLGAAVGAWLGAEVYSGLDLRWLPAIIGVLILVLTWLPLPPPRGSGQFSLFLLGLYQTGLGMVAGATGPLGAAVLMRHNTGKDWLVVNTAVYMSLNHSLRVFAFMLLGFSYYHWLPLITAMVVAATAGSLLGTWLRQYLPQRDFRLWFRWLVTLLALRMILHPLLQRAN